MHAQRPLCTRQTASAHKRFGSLKVNFESRRSSVMAALTILELYTSELIPQLSKNFKLLQRAYELGEVDIQRVSQTRERLLDAMTQYTKARVLYFDRAVTLEGLVGTEQWSKPLESYTMNSSCLQPVLFSLLSCFVLINACSKSHTQTFKISA